MSGWRTIRATAPRILAPRPTRRRLCRRNRLDAMELLGWDVLDHNGRLLGHYEGMNLFDDDDVVAWVISANIRRRHLNQAQKREMLGKLLKVDPSKSNRSIAKAAGVDDKTVGCRRGGTRGRCGNSAPRKTVGADGVAQAATEEEAQAARTGPACGYSRGDNPPYRQQGERHSATGAR